MLHRLLAAPIAILSFSMAILSGCGSMSGADDPAVVEQRAKLLLQDEPSNPRLVQNVRGDVEKNSAQESVSILAKIGGVADPWSKGRAGFVVIDPDTADHDENCQDDNCEHCRRNREKKRYKATALVEFMQDGKVVPIDARKLLRVKEGQLVVVRGRPKLSDDTLVIEADGLYIRE